MKKVERLERFDELSFRQWKALGAKLGGMDAIKAILKGKIGVELKELIWELIDKNGRMIPPAGMKSAVCDSNINFKLVQPNIDCREKHNRSSRFFPNQKFVSVEKFQEMREALIEQLRQDPFLSNLLNGVHLPFCFPQFTIGDYGEDHENIFLKAVGDSYKDQFPEREFHNHREGELVGKVGIVSGSRQDQFIAKMAEGPGVGIMFFPFQGYSIDAVREMMALLPKSLFLAGPIDIAIAMTAYPDVLARDFNTPGYDCAGIFWQSSGYSLYFGADDGKLRFGSTDFLGGARGRYSSGLVFLG